MAGLLVLLLGLLLTGGLYAVFSPASRPGRRLRQPGQARAASCSWSAARSATAQNGEGVKTLDGNQFGPPLAGVGAAAVDFQVGTGRMPAAQPGPQILQKPVRLHAHARSPSSRRTSPRSAPVPAIPNAADYSLDGLTTRSARRRSPRGGQIFLTNCTACHNFAGAGGAMPRGGYAPKIRGVEPKYIFEAMLTGPQAMDTFSNGNLSPEEKRDIIAYLQSLQDNPGYGGFGLGGIGPVSEGLFAWLVGIGSLVGVAVWIAAHTARSSKKKVEL